MSFDPNRGTGTTNAVVYKKQILAPDGRVFTLMLYFPDEYHSNTRGYVSQPITQADIANINLKGKGNLDWKGKWKKWFESTIDSASWNTQDVWDRLDMVVSVHYTSEMKRFQRRWKNALHSGGWKTALDQYAADIKKEEAALARIPKEFTAKTRKKIGIGFSLGATYTYDGTEHSTPDFWGMIPRSIPMSERPAWVKEKKREFVRQLRTAKTSMANRKSMISELKRGLTGKKMHIMKEFGGAQLEEDIVKYSDLAEAARINKDFKKAEFYSQMIVASQTPYALGLNARSAIAHAGIKARDALKEVLRGGKAPDIVEKTKRNRAARGNPEEPPLKETGEFIDSLQYVVIG